MSNATIDDLPDEVLEYIFCLLPPYEDIRCCMLVCKRWCEIAENIVPRIRQSFSEAISTQNVTWDTFYTEKDNITKRYAHSACRHNDSMYVFGGFTSSFSSFNDLWKFDLSTRTWTRIGVQGKCPVPKAGATMVTYEDKLILFGGLLPPTYGMLYQNHRLSSHLHIYDITNNKWSEINCNSDDFVMPELAGHSCTIHKDKMVIFGGLGDRLSVNDVYSLNLITMKWKLECVSGEKPPPRYGHSQVHIDETHLMIMGGVDNDPLFVFDDAWLLNMSEDDMWSWKKVDLGIHAPLVRTVWCHPVCKVGKFIVVFKPNTGNPGMYADWFPIQISRNTNSNQTKSQEINLNGKRGILNRASLEENVPDKNKFKKSIGSKPTNIREFLPLNRYRTPILEMHTIDTTNLLEDGKLTSVKSKFRSLNCPTDTILYSIVEGNGELIMFGGIQREIINYEDGTEEREIKIIDTLHVIKAKRKVI